MSYISKYTVAKELARRAVQFHKNEKPMEITLWGLFRWGEVSRYIKTGDIIPNNGYSKENRTIWCKPSQSFFNQHVAPLIEEAKIKAIEDPNNWYINY